MSTGERIMILIFCIFVTFIISYPIGYQAGFTEAEVKLQVTERKTP